ncbi:MAG: hypothetical protein HXK63_03720 [Campylobacter sp.]|nr:hypothetical protein [Campylobacter sp.]
MHAQEAGAKPMRRRNEAAYTSGVRSMREQAVFAGLVAGVSARFCEHTSCYCVARFNKTKTRSL